MARDGGFFRRLTARGQSDEANGSPAPADAPSWVPPETPDSTEEERTRWMAAATAASTKGHAQPGSSSSWLPAEQTTESPAAPESAAEETKPTVSKWEPQSATPQPPSDSTNPWLVGQQSAAPTAPAETPNPSSVSTATRRQALAVESYCRELCPKEAAAAVADEVLGSFTGNDNIELLRHTRRTVASHVTVPSTRKGWLRSEPDAVCQVTPRLLAARANDELDGAERERLERHLESCLTCQAMELRMRRAERAFAGVAGIALAAQPTEAPAPAVAPAKEAPTSHWVAPAAAAAAAPVAAAAATQEAPAADLLQPQPAERRRSRRAPVAVLAAGGTLAAAAIAAAVLLSSGSSKHHNVARATTPIAPVTTPVTPPKHKAAKKKPAAKRHHVAKKPATHHAAPAAAPAPAVASATPAPAPAPTPKASAPTASSSPPVSSSPPASSSPTSSSSSSSSPSVSIQQPSLGQTGGSQGIGH